MVFFCGLILWRFFFTTKNHHKFYLWILNCYFMSDLKQIRQITGLSQAAMAGWLGVSESLVQFVETGERSLPSEANRKMAAMLRLSEQVKNTATPAKEGPALGSPVKLAERHRKKMAFYQRSAAGLRIKLTRLRQVNQRLNTRMALLEAMKNSEFEWYSASPGDKKRMEYIEWFSNERLPRSGPEEQELLEDKIETNLAYAELHRKRWEWYEGMVGE